MFNTEQIERAENELRLLQALSMRGATDLIEVVSMIIEDFPLLKGDDLYTAINLASASHLLGAWGLSELRFERESRRGPTIRSEFNQLLDQLAHFADLGMEQAIEDNRRRLDAKRR